MWRMKSGSLERSCRLLGSIRWRLLRVETNTKKEKVKSGVVRYIADWCVDRTLVDQCVDNKQIETV